MSIVRKEGALRRLSLCSRSCTSPAPHLSLDLQSGWRLEFQRVACLANQSLVRLPRTHPWRFILCSSFVHPGRRHQIPIFLNNGFIYHEQNCGGDDYSLANIDGAFNSACIPFTAMGKYSSVGSLGAGLGPRIIPTISLTRCMFAVELARWMGVFGRLWNLDWRISRWAAR